MHANPKLPVYSPPSILVTINSFSKSVKLFFFFFFDSEAWDVKYDAVKRSCWNKNSAFEESKLVWAVFLSTFVYHHVILPSLTQDNGWAIPSRFFPRKTRPFLGGWGQCCCSVAKSCLFVTPWTAASQAPLSFTINWSLLKFMSIESVSDAFQPPHPLSSPSLPVYSLSQHQGLIPMSQLFTSGGQSIGVSASASVLSVNFQGWFPLGWTGLTSLQSKGLSSVFSSSTVRQPAVCKF